MEKVVSSNNMEEINPSDKGRKEAKEEILLELRSIYETIEAVTKLVGLLETLCRENVRQLTKAARTLVRIEKLRNKAELERQEKLREQNAMALEALVLHEIQKTQRGMEDAEICKENKKGILCNRCNKTVE